MPQVNQFVQQLMQPLKHFSGNRNPRAYTQGLTLYRQKQWQQAVECFTQATIEQPNHAPSHFKLGMSHFRLKEYETALAAVNRALELDPSQTQWQEQLDQTARHVAAKAKQSPSDKEQTIRDQLERLDNPSAHLYNQLAHTLRKQGKWWQEIEALKSAIALESNHPTWFYRLGEALEVMNRYQQAAKAYGNAIELKNGKAEAQWHYRQGYCFAREGHDGAPNLKAANEAYQQAIKKDSKLNAKRYGIGVFHQARGHWQQAALEYQQQVAQAPWDAQLHYRLGMAHDRCYEWALAEACYKAALTLDRNQPDWHYRLGFVKERQEKYKQAALAYRYAALNRDKHTPYWFYRWGYVLEQQGNYQAAAEAYLQTRQQPTLDKEAFVEQPADVGATNTDEAVAIEPMQAVEQEKNVLELYEAQFTSQQFLIYQLEQIVEKDTTNTDVWYQLGNAYEREKNWQAAAQAYQHALARQNDHTPEWFYRLGYVLNQVEQYQEACDALRHTRILQKAYGVPDDKFKKDAGFRQAATYTEYYEGLAIQPKTVLYESFHGASMSCNPYALFLYLIEAEEYKDWTHIWVVNDLEKVPAKFKTMTNVVFVKRYSDAYMCYLASTSYLINNSTFPGFFIRKEKQFYLNTWHGTPWKTLGKDIKNSPFEYANTARNFLHATHIISPNQHTTKVLLERYDIAHLYTGVVAETGYPRIDLTLNAKDAKKLKIRQQLNLDASKPVVLYAPTWRGELGSASEDTDKIYKEIKVIQSLGVQVLFRGHYFVETAITGTDLSSLVVPEDINTNELLSVVDCLVTDYSSVAFDFMVTSKPIIYFVEDYEEYSSVRGLYLEVDSLPGVIAYNLDELKKGVESALIESSPHRNYETAKKQYVPNENGEATEEVVHLFFEGNSEQSKLVSYPKKNNFLIYGGEFQPNGITTSLINLVNNIKDESVSVTLTYDPKTLSDVEDRLEQFARLPEYVHGIPRTGRMNRTIEESWIETKMNQHNSLQSHAMWQVYEKLFAREFDRVYGKAQFHAVINFTGYGRFWAALFGCTKIESSTMKSIYQHNDKYNEWSMKFPSLESVFNLYKYYERVVSVSELTCNLNKQSLCQSFSLDSNKFIFSDNLQNPQEVLHRADENIGDEDQHLIEQASHVFITLGRLSLEKDHEKLIKAFAMVVEKQPKAKLLILGDGPLKQHLIHLVESLNLTSSVHLLGRRLNPFPMLKRADCFVLSSNHEGQPMVLFEAMILKKPIISTDIVGSRSAIEGRSGHLVENSEVGLAQGMLDFLDGKLTFPEYEITDYQEQALDMFYTKVCELEKTDA